jgi:hypothetical protein
MACDRDKKEFVIICFLEKQAHGKNASNIAVIGSDLSSALVVIANVVAGLRYFERAKSTL